MSTDIFNQVINVTNPFESLDNAAPVQPFDVNDVSVTNVGEENSGVELKLEIFTKVGSNHDETRWEYTWQDTNDEDDCDEYYGQSDISQEEALTDLKSSIEDHRSEIESELEGAESELEELQETIARHKNRIFSLNAVIKGLPTANVTIIED